MSEQERRQTSAANHHTDLGDIDWSRYERELFSEVAKTVDDTILRKREAESARSQAEPVPMQPHHDLERSQDWRIPQQPVQPIQQDGQMEELTRHFGHMESQTPPPPPPPQEPEEEYRDDDREPAPKKHRRVRSLAVTFLVAVLYVVCVLSIAFMTATVGWRWAGDLLALNKEPLTASVTIGAGDSIHSVALQLQEKGLIEYPFLFEAFAGLTNKAEDVSSGTYELNTDMDFSALLTSISASSRARETVIVTIPEGYTVEEVFELLETQGACTKEQLEYSALHDSFDYSFLKELERGENPYWMEGYLFPDTYEFYKDGDAKLVLSKILHNYLSKFDADLKNRAEWLGYSQEEIMIIASIIEKETDGMDQNDIASVIYNRLTTDGDTLGKLQMDSTIQYALEERKEHLTESDLKIESPYNTYLHEGLPAGPICNPGMKSIQAALYPNATDYFYFILGNDGTTHFFSEYNDFITFRNQVQAKTDQPSEEEATEETDNDE